MAHTSTAAVLLTLDSRRVWAFGRFDVQMNHGLPAPLPQSPSLRGRLAPQTKRLTRHVGRPRTGGWRVAAHRYQVPRPRGQRGPGSHSLFFPRSLGVLINAQANCLEGSETMRMRHGFLIQISTTTREKLAPAPPDDRPDRCVATNIGDYEAASSGQLIPSSS